MSDEQPVVEQVTRENLEKVLPLIAEYQRFYEKTPNEENNRNHFGRVVDSPDMGALFCAHIKDGDAQKMVAFATVYFVPSSLSAGTSATFNDLYCQKDARGSGAAIAVALRTFEHAREQGHGSIAWLTQPGNKTAQRIYDFTHAERSEWVMYDLALG